MTAPGGPAATGGWRHLARHGAPRTHWEQELAALPRFMVRVGQPDSTMILCC